MRSSMPGSLWMWNMHPPSPAAWPALQHSQATAVRLTVWTISALVLLAALALLILLAATVVSSTIPFDNDEANHAVDGWEVYHALAMGSPAALYRAVTEQGFYPPTHSFIVAGAYLLAGATLPASRLPTVVIFALTLLLLAWLTVRLGRRVASADGLERWLPLAGAAFAVVFALSSEIFVRNGVLLMFEMTGALLGLLLLLLVDRADIPVQRSRWDRLLAAALIVFLLGLTKYTFGLYFLPGLAAALVTARWPWLVSRRAWLEVTLVLAICAVLFGLWVAVTDRTTLLYFFADHPHRSDLLSADNLLYYAVRWFNGYSPNLYVGWLTLLLAGVATVRGWRWLAVRTALWSVLVGFTLLAISPTDEPRHFVPLTPLIWLLAGVGLVEVLCWVWAKTQNEFVIAGALIALFLLVVVGAIPLATGLPTLLNQEFEGAPALARAQDFALQRVDLGQSVLFIGDFSDQNGLLAVRWRAATLTNKSLWDLDVDYFPFENHEHSLARTNRKPQIVTVDPTFPRQHMNEVLARDHFAFIVEMKQLANYFGPRANNPEDPLCGYPAVQEQFDDWVVIIYTISPEGPQPCV